MAIEGTGIGRVILPIAKFDGPEVTPLTVDYACTSFRVLPTTAYNNRGLESLHNSISSNRDIYSF
jgi:hypothetical protein